LKKAAKKQSLGKSERLEAAASRLRRIRQPLQKIEKGATTSGTLYLFEMQALSKEHF